MHKVLLVDDQKLIRDGIKSLLGLSGKVAGQDHEHLARTLA